MHQEGIDHIKSQSGTEHTGGVSSSAPVDSSVPAEQKTMVQSTVDTVKGYLGFGGGSTATTDSKVGGQETGPMGRAESDNSSSAASGGYVASTTAAISAATAAVVGKKESTTAEEAKDSSVTDSATTNPSASTSAAARDESVTNTPKKDETVTKRSDDDEDNKLSEAPGAGASASKKDNWPKENRDAIPTAGGEKLGEKHWGESQVVPDVPKPQGEQANVSSREGQPDSES